MGKLKYTSEYSVNFSPKLVFPYLSTADGLGEWFAEKAIYHKDKDIWNFIWDNKDHYARLVSLKPNKLVKFEFLPDENEEDKELSTVEMKLITSELSQDTFLAITDYSNISDEEELKELWEGLIHSLIEALSGE